MLPAQRLLDEITVSLRTVIVPAITDPYARAQAAMAAVILEFVARQVAERDDIAVLQGETTRLLFAELAASPAGSALLDAGSSPDEAHLCRVIERLYAGRDQIDAETFTLLRERVRATLRARLDAELQVAGPPAR